MWLVTDLEMTMVGLYFGLLELLMEMQLNSVMEMQLDFVKRMDVMMLFQRAVETAVEMVLQNFFQTVRNLKV